VKVFLAYPFADRQIAMSLDHVLRDAGCDVVSPSSAVAGTDLISEISSAIRAADLLVALVTTNNPNVFYEIGLAAGANVPTLIVALTPELLPAHLVSIPYVHLTGDVSRDLHEVVQRTKALAEPPRPKPVGLGSAHAALLAAAREPTLLEALSPMEFEALTKRLFEERGYRVLGGRSDEAWGSDFLIDVGDRGLVAVEVKKLSRQGRVSVETVRNVSAAVAAVGASSGMVVSSSGFTTAAQAFAQATRVALVGLPDLLESTSGLASEAAEE
jgi:hypothetical protein